MLVTEGAEVMLVAEAEAETAVLEVTLQVASRQSSLIDWPLERLRAASALRIAAMLL